MHVTHLERVPLVSKLEKRSRLAGGGAAEVGGDGPLDTGE